MRRIRLNASGGEIRKRETCKVPNRSAIQSDYMYDDDLVSQSSRSQRATPCLIVWEGSKVMTTGHAHCLQRVLHILFIFDVLVRKSPNISALLIPIQGSSPRRDHCCSRLLRLRLKTFLKLRVAQKLESTSTRHCLPG